MALRMLLPLMGNALFTGDFKKVTFFLDFVRKTIEPSLNAPLSALFLLTFKANYYWLCNEFEKNRKLVEEGLALAEQTGIHVFDILLLGHGAAGSLSTGEIEQADHHLEKMRASKRIMCGN